VPPVLDTGWTVVPMTRQLRNYPVDQRAGAVVDAFYAIAPNLDGGPRRADITYDNPFSGVVTVRAAQLIGLGYNPTQSGTQHALVIRTTFGSHACELIPYTRLISISEPEEAP
jgi:hypothetical protein